MTVKLWAGKKEIQSTKSHHAEEEMERSGKYSIGNLNLSMNAWPCRDEKHHNCHQLLIRMSLNRVITLQVTSDVGGYAKTHGYNYGDTGTITYTNGVVTVAID